MTRNTVRSRASRTAWSRAENCQATAAAEDTSTTESSPNPIKAVDEADTDVRVRHRELPTLADQPDDTTRDALVDLDRRALTLLARPTAG